VTTATEESIDLTEYKAPERASTWERALQNVIPVARGFVRFKLNPFHRSSGGKLVRIRGSLKLKDEGVFTFGTRVNLRGKHIPISIHVAKGATLQMGNRVSINYGVDIGCFHSITLGNDVRVGPMTSILDDPLHEVEPGMPSRPKTIVIEDNVWITRNCVIQPGVTIGRNSVIASGSVVTKDIPANSLAGGAPARVIRELTIPDGWRR